MNKIIVIAGQTGVGKTNIAHNIARKINGEIICVDSVQLYKDLNIIANKPNKFLQETVKYHNLNEYDILKGNIGGILHAEKIRKTIKEIWSRNKTPILEGGCGFYLKMILTGGSTKFTKDEETEYDKSLLISKELIKYDSHNFDKTFQRLIKIDETLPLNLILKNDFYRLEKRLAEALLFGNGAYKIMKIKEEKIRNENKFSNDTSIFNYFLYCDKIKLNKKLEQRCEKMIENGLIKEVSDLITYEKITPQMFIDKNVQSVFLNAFGLYETTNFLINLLEVKNKKEEILLSYGDHISKKDAISNKYKKIVEKIIYNYLCDFSCNNRNYARRQALWFKNNENFLWINSEIDQTLLTNNIIENYTNLSNEEFTKIKNSDDNKNTKEKYNYKEMKNYKYVSKFDILNNKYALKNLIEDGFNYADINFEKLMKIKNNLEKINTEKNKNKSSVNKEFTEQNLKDINLDLIEKYIKI